MIYEMAGVEQLYYAIKKLAWQYLPERAEDLAQDVALKLWSNRMSLPQRFHGGFLRKVVRNAAWDALRKEHKHKLQLNYFFVNENGTISTVSEPERQFYVCEPTNDCVDARRSLSDINEAMADLSSEQKEVITLRADGWTCAEIAEKQAVSTVTVRTRIYYARKKLEQTLGGTINE